MKILLLLFFLSQNSLATLCFDHQKLVLVGGTFTDVSKSELEKFSEELKQSHPELDVTYLEGSTRLPMEENAENLKNELLNQAVQSSKNLVVFAHSKSGGELMLAMMSSSELVEKIDQAVLFQSVLEGGIYFTDQKGLDGIRSMDSSVTREVFSRVKKNVSSMEQDQIRKKTFFQPTFISSRDAPVFYKFPTWRMEKRGMLSDGVVPFESQKMKEWGVSLPFFYHEHSAGFLVEKFWEIMRRTHNCLSQHAY